MSAKRLSPARRVLCALLSLLLLGASAFFVWYSAATPLPILMYHSLSDNPDYQNDYCVSPAEFEADLRYIRDNGYTTVSAAQLLAFCGGEAQLPEKPVMLTFDDGCLGVLTHALPLLEEYGMCAVVSIVGGYSDFYTENPATAPDASFLSWPQVSQLAESPLIELASHTHGMHGTKERQGCKIMPGESGEAYAAALGADIDLMESRFSQWAGQAPALFAYPFGEVCAQARDLLTERGCRVLFTTEPRTNRLTGDIAELLSLGRYNRTPGIDPSALFRRMENPLRLLA